MSAENPAPPPPLLVDGSPPGDPNANIVYDVLFDVTNLEQVAQLKWDIFSIEQRLDRVLREDLRLDAQGPSLKQELTLALDTFRANEDVGTYKERFVQNAERLKLMELIRFLELAVVVREPLQEAWAKYLAFDHDRLLAELAAVDIDHLARKPATLIQGVRETGSRRCNAVIAHTERNARQVFKEIPYRDWAKVIAWHEEKNPSLSNLIAEARVLYLHAEVARGSAGIARQVRFLALACALFTAIAAAASLLALARR